MTKQEGMRLAKKYPKTLRVSINENSDGDVSFSVPHPDNKRHGIDVFSEGDIQAEYQLVRVLRRVPAEEELPL